METRKRDYGLSEQQAKLDKLRAVVDEVIAEAEAERTRKSIDDFRTLTPGQIGVIDAMGDPYFTSENIQFWLGVPNDDEKCAAEIDGYLEAASQIIKNKDAVIKYLQTL